MRALALLAASALMWAGAAAADEPLPAPEPCALAYTRDEARAVSKHIEAETGGTIEAVNAAGDVFRLKIEPDTLYADATITLTPLDGATGIDGATRTLAVAMEPAGTEFTSPAALTVTPKEALAGDIWWFESPPGADGGKARPALPLKGQSGMTVWHFSTGAVAAGGPELSGAVAARAPGEVSSSSVGVSQDWLDWRRAQTEQDYQSGRIDAVKHDTEIGIINDLKERLAAEAAEAAARDIQRKLDEGVAESEDLAGVAETIAERGDPADLDRLTDLMRDILAAERQAQLLGKTTGIGGRTEEIMRRYADGFADRCAHQRDMGRQTAKFVLDLERTMQMTGLSSDDSTGGVAGCLNREWSAGGQPSQSPYGRVVITLKKSSCAMGVWGSYTYEVTGAITGSFTFEAMPPKDGFVTFTPFTLRAKLAPEWASETYTCTQSGELSIGEPPGAFFKATVTGSGECLKEDDMGSVDIVDTDALPLRPGPLCDARAAAP